MNSETTSEGVRAWDLLMDLGFTDGISDMGSRALHFDFGNFKVEAISCDNRLFVPIVLITGIVRTERTLQSVGIELRQISPPEEKVFYHLCRELDKFKPEYVPDWLEQDRQRRRKIEEQRIREIEERIVAREACPKCHALREWARKALRPFAKQARAAEISDEHITFHFDGESLRIEGAGDLIHVPAEGVAWTKEYTIPLVNLRLLLNRFPEKWNPHPITFEIWESKLYIDGISYEGIN